MLPLVSATFNGHTTSHADQWVRLSVWGFLIVLTALNAPLLSYGNGTDRWMDRSHHCLMQRCKNAREKTKRSFENMIKTFILWQCKITTFCILYCCLFVHLLAVKWPYDFKSQNLLHTHREYFYELKRNCVVKITIIASLTSCYFNSH